MREILVDGHQLAAIGGNESAPGTPVIFLHGINSSINFWTYDLPLVFADERRWYSLSLPGHFPAKAPPDFSQETLTAEGMSYLLLSAIEQLVGKSPVLLVGHSTGGFFALHLAALYPEHVEAVICVSGFARGHWTGLLGMYQHMVRLGVPGRWMYKFLYGGVKLTPHYLAWVLNTFYTGNGKKLQTHPLFKQILAGSHADFKPQDLNAMIAYFYRMPDIDITPQLSRIKAPTLVIVGSRDPLVNPDQSSQIVRQVKNSQLQVIRNVGHVPMWEDPDGYKKIISEWVTHKLAGK